MTAIEAMIYCLGHIDDKPEDGEFHSRVVYDRFGTPHWIAWNFGLNRKPYSPRLCSEDIQSFSSYGEPYSTSPITPEGESC